MVSGTPVETSYVEFRVVAKDDETVSVRRGSYEETCVVSGLGTWETATTSLDPSL